VPLCFSMCQCVKKSPLFYTINSFEKLKLILKIKYQIRFSRSNSSSFRSYKIHLLLMTAFKNQNFIVFLFKIIAEIEQKKVNISY